MRTLTDRYRQRADGGRQRRDGGARLLRAAAIVVLALLFAGPSARADAAEERRVALVIGIGNYENATRLINPPKDAAAMADALRHLGFDVVEGLDLDRQDLTVRLREFSKKAAGADLALVFYAGHGVQVDNENWLLPRDVKLADRIDLEFEAIDVTALLRAMDKAKGRVLLLDACRNNPFSEGFLSRADGRSISRGLARLNVTDTGTLIAFATSPGAVADDGSSDGGTNSPFTTGLLANMRIPGLEIRQVLTRARQSVIAATHGRQTPWENSSLVADIYLAGLPAAPVADSLDLTFWKAIETSQDPSDFELFMKKFPNSELASLATSKLGALSAKPRSEQPAGEAPEPKLARDCPTCPDLVPIPAGSFVMGAPASDESASQNERPAHRADVSAIAMTRYPVTFDEWQACVAEGGCATKPADAGWGRGLRPVINVSWLDAHAYADWLSRKTGFHYRLPSETEWEYAARAGSTETRFWGGDPARACDYANVYDRTSVKSAPMSWKPHGCSDGFVYTSPVGSFKPNAWGLGDMIGNVWQWVEDCWTDDYSAASGSAVAVASQTCTERVLRGGSWMSDAAAARSTTRMRSDAADKDINIGFRLVRDPK